MTPGTREEMLRGELIYAQPAKPPHAERHLELDYVIRAYIIDGYIGATDMLTKAGPRSQFATDTAIRKAGKDPATGKRYVEELAFEVVSTQTMREMIMRAEDLMEAGVRRLFGIFVERDPNDHDLTKRAEVREWSQQEHCFVPLSPDAEIVDPTLARPLPVRALLDRVRADDAVVDALDSKDNPRLRSIKSRELERGLEQGRIEAIVSVCSLLDIELTAKRRAHLETLDAAGLQALREQIETHRSWPE